MSYYNDVYLKRVNRFGYNLQERIINKKEYDFNNFVNKSPNKVTVFIQDFKFEGVLQSKEYDEIETIDYFLTFKSINIPSGTIIKVLDIKNPDLYTFWIVICKDNFVSAGYDRYTVVKLDREIRWITNEGYIYKALVHISGAGANARDKRITSSFKNNQQSIVFLPTQNLTITMQDNPEIKRGVRVNIKNQIWKISGADNISNDGVSYVTLEQDYTDEKRDDTVHLEFEPENQDAIADGYKIGKWDFSCSLFNNLDYTIIDDITYPTLKFLENSENSVDFIAYYFSKQNNSELLIGSENNDIVEYKDRTFYAKQKGETFISVRLKDSPDISKKYYVKVADRENITDFFVEIPSRLKVGKMNKIYCIEPFSYAIKSPLEEIDKVHIGELKQEARDGIDYYYREIEADKIIKSLIITFTNNNEDTYTKKFTVESIWLGGN